MQTLNNTQILKKKPFLQILSSLRIMPLKFLLFLGIFAFLPMQGKYLHQIFKGSTFLNVLFLNNFCIYLSDIFLFFLIALCIFSSSFSFRTFFWNSYSRWLTLFLCLVLFSIGKYEKAPPLGIFFEWYKLAAAGFLFCFLLKEAAFLQEKVWIPKIFQLLVGIALIQCAIGIGQYFTKHSLGLRFLGEELLRVNRGIGASFLMADGSRWIFDRIFHISSPTQAVLRAYGTFPHPNFLGGFLIFSLLASYHLYVTLADKKYRKWLALAIFVQVVCLLLTYSRSAVFGLVIATGIWFLFVLVMRKIEKKTLFSLGAILFSCIALCALLFYPQIWQRGGIVNYQPINQMSDEIRTAHQNLATQYIKQSPFWGLGYQNYINQPEGLLVLPAGLPKFSVHNTYLLIGAEIGLPGLCVFLIFLMYLLYKAFRCRRNLLTTTLLSVFISYLFVAACDYYFIANQHGRFLFFTVLGLLAVSIPKQLQKLEI